MNLASVRLRTAAGRSVDLGNARVSARVVRDLWLGRGPMGSAAPLRLEKAHITGRLDLGGHVAGRAVFFSGCTFDAVDLTGLRTAHPMVFTQSCFTAFVADELVSTADLVLRDCEVTGGLSLVGARVAGNLDCTGTCLRSRGTVCLKGRNLRVGGEIICERGAERGFLAHGEVDLQWAHAKALRATGARLVNPRGCALRADGLHVTDDIFLNEGFRAWGVVTLVGARLGDELRCTGGRFLNCFPPSEANLQGRALDVERIEANDIYLDRGFLAYGEVRLVGAQLETQLNCTSGDFLRGWATFAVNADEVVAGGDIFLNGDFTAVGEVRLVGAKIGRELNCTGGTFMAHPAAVAPEAEGKGPSRKTGVPGRFALNADGLTTEGSVFLNKDFVDDDVSGKREVQFTACGSVRFARATVGRQFDCTGADFRYATAEEEVAVDLAGLVCKGDVLLSDAHVSGGVSLRGACVSRNVKCEGTRFETPPGLPHQAVFCGVDMRTEGTFAWKPRPTKGEINLLFAYAAQVEDTGDAWPGLKEEDSKERKRSRRRVAWLAKNANRAARTETGIDPSAARRAGRKAQAQVVEHAYRGTYDLVGFGYESLAGMTCQERTAWLRGTKTFSPLPWQQLAAYYRNTGQAEQAKEVVVAMHEEGRVRGGLKPHAKAWDWFVGTMTAYGYKLYRPFVFVLVLWLIGVPLFYTAQVEQVIQPTRSAAPGPSASPAATARAAPPPPFAPVPAPEQESAPSTGAEDTRPDARHCTSRYPCYIFWLYPFELLMPVLNLWLVGYWLPSPDDALGWFYMCLSFLYILAGWVFGISVAAGARHLLTSD